MALLAPANPQPREVLLHLSASLSASVCQSFPLAHLSNHCCCFQMEYLDTQAGTAGCSRRVFTLPQLSWEWERARPAAGTAVLSPRASSGARQPVCPAHVSCRGQMCHLGRCRGSPACAGRGMRAQPCRSGAGCGQCTPGFSSLQISQRCSRHAKSPCKRCNPALRRPAAHTDGQQHSTWRSGRGASTGTRQPRGAASGAGRPASRCP